MSTNDPAAAYKNDQIAKDYLKHAPVFPDSVAQEIIKHMKVFDPEKSARTKFDGMLDVACGSGQSIEMFVPYFDSITGIDISAPVIKAAEEHNRHTNVTYQLVHGSAFPLKDNSVDLVTCGCSIHRLDFDAFLSECQRVLKPNGCIACFFVKQTYLEVIQGELVTKCSVTEFGKAFEEFFEDYDAPAFHEISKSRYKSLYDILDCDKVLIPHQLSFKVEYNCLNDMIERYKIMPDYQIYMRQKPTIDPLHVFVKKIKRMFKDGLLKDDGPKVRINLDVPMLIFKRKDK